MVILNSSAHIPASGVKVYSVVTELFMAGDQLPSTPFIDCDGKGFNVASSQIGFTCIKAGTIGEVILMVLLKLKFKSEQPLGSSTPVIVIIVAALIEGTVTVTSPLVAVVMV